MNEPRRVVGDGHLGIWGVLANVYTDSEEQRCWNHRVLNVLDKVPKREQYQARMLLTQIPYAETREEAEKLKLLGEVAEGAVYFNGVRVRTAEQQEEAA